MAGAGTGGRSARVRPVSAAVAGPLPGFARRFGCFLYEGVLLFGVVMFVGLIYAGLTQQRHALIGMRGLQAALFFVIGAYFVAFWTRGGQTLAMKTWHIRLLTADGSPVKPLRAACRYLLSWLWFAPALVAVRLSGLQGTAPALAALAAGVGVYALMARLHPSRQSPHDLLCGTRLVSCRPHETMPGAHNAGR